MRAPRAKRELTEATTLTGYPVREVELGEDALLVYRAVDESALDAIKTPALNHLPCPATARLDWAHRSEHNRRNLAAYH